MLSYRHSFHAGNHADVLKHIVLMLILENLSLKEKGFYYLDTHSGVGRYRLSSNDQKKLANTKRELGDFGKKRIYPKKLHATWILLKSSIMVVKNYVITPDLQ